MKRSFLVAAVLAVFAIAGFAVSGDRRALHEDFGFHGLSKSLDLSAEQKDKLNALKTAGAESLKNADQSIAKVDLGAAFKADVFDRGAFVAAATARANANIEKRADFLAELHAILTPSQREILAKNFERKPRYFSDRIPDRQGDFGAREIKPIEGDRK
jgi:Spy/CpxP family protein refolding chaperone